MQSEQQSDGNRIWRGTPSTRAATGWLLEPSNVSEPPVLLLLLAVIKKIIDSSARNLEIDSATRAVNCKSKEVSADALLEPPRRHFEKSI